MIKHKEIKLGEQKYAGIKTKIMFPNHDHVDFSDFHKQVTDELIDASFSVCCLRNKMIHSSVQ